MFVPYYSASRSLSSYAYFAVIPGEDISQQILPSVLFSLSIVIIFLIFAFLLAIRNASHIINPLKDIVNAFTQNNDEHISGNLLEDAKNLARSSRNTSEELTRLIPYAQEKYLSSLLYSTEYSIDDDVAKKLDFEVISDCLNQPLEKAYQDMMHLINYTLGFSEKLIQSKLTHIEIIDFIDKNYHLPELSLDYLADNFHVSPSNVSMIVKNITGFGFREYLSNLRVERASYLLTHTDQSIQEICDTCGFNSIKTFYRIFKNATNMTPKKYRQDGKKIN